MAFPVTRLRRLRRTSQLRDLVRETRLTPDAFVYPLFVCSGEGVRKAVRSMPGVFNLSVDEAVKEAREVHSLGVSSVILFGLPDKKDDVATGAWADEGIVQQAARALKREVPGLILMGDVCLCEYMSHGHCGIVKPGSMPQSLGAAARDALQNSTRRGMAVKAVKSREEKEKVIDELASMVAEAVESRFEIDNDASLELLARTAVSLARAGIDIIAPSDMMDGRVAAIRRALDDASFENTPILSYAAKFASGFYGPFREAADSTPQFGDRRSYQMDGANLREAMREIELDIEEGADMIMVKPALPYLDVIAAARLRFDLPLAAYQVSGEYAMIEAAAQNGWIERDRVMMESLQSIQRAGASIILTYYAKDAAKLLG
ncbi:MAG: porphobilinogen synthase [Candidatus Sulfotelmatobacter sp.]